MELEDHEPEPRPRPHAVGVQRLAEAEGAALVEADGRLSLSPLGPPALEEHGHQPGPGDQSLQGTEERGPGTFDDEQDGHRVASVVQSGPVTLAASLTAVQA